MTILKAIQKIIKRYGGKTYAEIEWYNSNGKSYPRRLDLELAVQTRFEYEHDCVYESPRPIPAHYRLSKDLSYDKDLAVFNIFSADEKTGELKLDAVITVFQGLEYPDQAWRETFKDTKYPNRCIPWWLNK